MRVPWSTGEGLLQSDLKQRFIATVGVTVGQHIDC
ncbi:MAG: hypothetical protein JWN14_1624, partial [Chthonomonadales bacterium]|nr:hypothetical protein [Chthonomonadales bacterium]